MLIIEQFEKRTMSEKLITPLEYFYQWESQTPETIFLRQPSGDSWKEYSYREAGIEVRKIVSALKQKGLKSGDHVGIYSKNCAHWVLADLAIMMAGMVSVPFYASLPTDQLREVIELSDIKALFIGRLDKWGDRDQAISADLTVINFPQYDDDVVPNVGENWNDLAAEVEPIEGQPVPDIDSVWTIKFTSGTTCLLYTSPSPRDLSTSRMPSSA